MISDLKQTARGFNIREFEDRYGNQCSLQKSSLATEDAIWFGIDDPKPQVLVPGQGWQTVPMPEDVMYSSRMHLTQEQVKQLLPFLQKFAETGELE